MYHIFIVQNIAECFPLALAIVINYDVVQITYWIAAASHKLCVLVHIQCY